MRIGVIEGDHIERGLLKRGLKLSLKKSIIQEFETAGEFLSTLQVRPNIDVLIMEHTLPLFPLLKNTGVQVSTDEQLGIMFPETLDWVHTKGAETVIRCMRKSRIETPVIIYSYSDKWQIEPEIFADPDVYHCKKDGSVENLLEVIREIIQGRIKTH